MTFAGFSQATLSFLAELSQHDDRAWFESQQTSYEHLVLEPAKALVETLGERLRELDPKIQAVPRLRGSIKRSSGGRAFRGEPPRPSTDVGSMFCGRGRGALGTTRAFFCGWARAVGLGTGMLGCKRRDWRSIERTCSMRNEGGPWSRRSRTCGPRATPSEPRFQKDAARRAGESPARRAFEAPRLVRGLGRTSTPESWVHRLRGLLLRAFLRAGRAARLAAGLCVDTLRLSVR